MEVDVPFVGVVAAAGHAHRFDGRAAVEAVNTAAQALFPLVEVGQAIGGRRLELQLASGGRGQAGFAAAQIEIDGQLAIEDTVDARLVAGAEDGVAGVGVLPGALGIDILGAQGYLFRAATQALGQKLVGQRVELMFESCYLGFHNCLRAGGVAGKWRIL